MSVHYVGNSVVEVSVVTGPVQEIPLPAGVRPNDMLVLTLLGSWGGLTHCTDTRMGFIHGVEHSSPGRQFKVWAGTAGSLADVQVELVGVPSELFGQFCLANLVVYRDEYGGEIQVLGGPEDMPVVDAPPPFHFESDTIVPAMDTEPTQAICAWAGHHDTIGGWTHDFFDAAPWVRHGEGSNGYLKAANYINGSFPVAASPHGLPAEAVSGLGWYAVAFAVSAGRKPTRQHPRDDGLGMSSAPRMYPPPKQQRTVGGYL